MTNSKIKDEEDVKLLDAIGLKSLPSIWVTPLRKTGKMSVMLRTDYDEEVMILLDAIGLKP